MELVLLTELQLLAKLQGPDSAAAEAVEVALAFDEPRIVRSGSHLFVYDVGGGATLSIRRFW